MADLLSCRVQGDDEEDMSGQAMVGQDAPGTLVSGDGNDSTDSQVQLSLVKGGHLGRRLLVGLTEVPANPGKNDLY